MQGPRVLSLGSVNADFQIRVDRYPRPGETLPGRDFVRLGGGKAANVAFLARRFGAEATLLAQVGEEEALRAQALGALDEAGVDLSLVGSTPDAETGVALIIVPPDGKKGIVLAGNANDCWPPQATARAADAVERAPQGSVLVADLEVPAEVVAAVLGAATGRAMPVVLDPSPADRAAGDLLKACTAVTPNTAETQTLVGVEVTNPESAVQAARVLAERGAALPLVKLPDGGCVLLDAGRAYHVPPEPVEVVDSTGAGDAFAGAFAVGMLEGMGPVEAACLAVAASSLAVRTYGSQPSYPERHEVDAVARRLAGRVQKL